MDSTKVKAPRSFRDAFRPRNIALGAALAFALLAYERGPASVLYFETKSFCGNKPVLWKLPQELRLDSRAPDTGHLVSQLGVTFSSPWGPETVVTNKSAIVVLSFGRNWNMGIFDPAVTQGVLNAVNKLPDPPDLTVALGTDAVSSNYQLKKAALSVTPDQISLWMDPKRLTRNCTFLMFKASEASGGESGIYEFRAPYVHGFQMGNPSLSKVVMLEAFTTDDHPIKLFFTSSKALNGELTQSEINTVLSTLYFAKEPGTRPSTNERPAH